ncbi:MAG: hypothetical protein WB771_10870 [Solirubrobacterales bacterium]
MPPASESGHQPHSEDELRELLRQSSREGLIEREEQELSDAALVFGDRRAGDAMTSRDRIDLALTTDSLRRAGGSQPAGPYCRSAGRTAGSRRPW